MTVDDVSDELRRRFDQSDAKNRLGTNIPNDKVIDALCRASAVAGCRVEGAHQRTAGMLAETRRRRAFFRLAKEHASQSSPNAIGFVPPAIVTAVLSLLLRLFLSWMSSQSNAQVARSIASTLPSVRFDDE